MKVSRWIEVDCPNCGMDYDFDDLSFWEGRWPTCCGAKIPLDRANFHVKVGGAILFIGEEDYRLSFTEG